MRKIIFLLILIVPLFFTSQRRNDFNMTDKNPNCSLIKKGIYADDRKESGDSALSYQIIFKNNKMIQVWGNNNEIVINSRIKYLSKCTFESEVIKIDSKFKFNDGIDKIGRKTIYELTETGKKYIILEYWCNKGRNRCTEILDRNRRFSIADPFAWPK